MRRSLSFLITCTVAFLGVLPIARAANFTHGSSVRIPLNPLQTVPASDLPMSPETAFNEAKEKGADLSLLEPKPSEFWTGAVVSGSIDETLSIQPGDTVTFVSTLLSGAGRLRFNVTNASGQYLSVVLTRTLHTYLLRKELLRALGYPVPAMKYLERVKVRFPDEKTRDFFLTSRIPLATDGAPSLWKTSYQDPNDSLVIELQDVAAIEAGSASNLAIAPPITVLENNQILPEKRRTIRALSLAYGIADVTESLNQMTWDLGTTSDQVFSFDVPDIANFSCGRDDAVWILRRMRNLRRADFLRMAMNARFPEKIAQLVAEKMISRRNDVFAAFDLAPATAEPADTELDLPPEIEQGKVTLKKWDGYASGFAADDTQSPLRDLQYYVLSQVENNAVEQLLKKANEKLPALTQADASKAHQDRLIRDAYEHWYQTGEMQSVPFGVWAGPVLNGSINVSRSVVIGNYLGTNNLVSLADDFGITVNAGVVLGVDGLPATLHAGAQVQATASIHFTRLKPLTRLKQAIQEPLKNEFVPWVKHHAAGLFQDLAELKETDDETKKKIQAEFEELDRFLGVGESFLMTENLQPTETVNVGAGVPIPLTPQVGVQAALNQLRISRLQIYRKSADVIQVFQDNGHLKGRSLTLQVTAGAPRSFPVLLLTGKVSKGSGQVRVFTVDISDPSKNPSFAANATALSRVLRTRSVSTLEERLKPVVIENGFRDQSGYFRFFHVVRRKLKTREQIGIKLPDGTDQKFISFADGSQKGKHLHQLGTDAANFLVQVLTNGGNPQLDTEASLNAGQSVLGHAETRNARFQGRLDAGALAFPSVEVQYRWQGWSKSRADTQALVDSLSAKYGFKLYNDGFLANLQALQLYEINLGVDLYESALEAIASITPESEKELETRSIDRHHCFLMLTKPECRAISTFRNAYDDLSQARSEGKLTDEKRAELYFKLASSLERFVEFPELVKIVGGPDRLYVHSTISGFRTETELPSVPILSNTYGKPDPVFPTGVIDAAQSILDLSPGELYEQWMREVL